MDLSSNRPTSVRLSFLPLRRRLGVLALLTALPLSVLTMSACDNEERDWQAAQTAQSTAGYAAFLAKRPAGRHAVEARGAITRIQWEDAERNGSAAAFEEFLRSNPDGELASRATSKLDELYRDRVLFPFVKDGKFGYHDATGATVVKPAYDYADESHDGLAAVQLGGKWGFLSSAGREVIPPRYDEFAGFDGGLAPVRQDGKWGYIDRKGAFAIAPTFEDAWPFSQGLALVKVGGKWGYIDRTAKLVIPARYDGAYFRDGAINLSYDPEKGWLTRTIDREKRIFVKQNAEFGMSNEPGKFEYSVGSGTRTCPTWADDFIEGMARVRVEDGGAKWGFIDRAGNTVIEPKYDYCARFSDGLALVVKKGRAGYVDSTGALRVPLSFSGGNGFKDGMARVTRDGARWGFIDKQGKVVVPINFAEAHDFAEGLAAVKVGAKWGFVDPSGRLVIEPKLGAATAFAEGLAAAQLGGKWGYIDRTGRFAIEPQFANAAEFSKKIAKVQVGSPCDPKVPVCPRSTSYIDATGKTIWGP